MKTTGRQTNGDSCWEELQQHSASGGLGQPAGRTQAELAKLTQTIEGEIIPRLMSAFDVVEIDYYAADSVQASQSAPELGSIEEFVRLLVTHDASTAAEYVRALRASGSPLQTIYLDLLAPAARHLGWLWEEDRCSFTEVTIGVGRMHQVLLEFSPCFCAHQSTQAADARSALIVPLPGELHNFGLFMVVEFFRRGGWNVWSGSPQADAELTAMLGRQHFDIVGISASADRHVSDLTNRIAAIRRESINKDVLVLVGGQAFRTDPGLARRVGADGMANDGREAVRLAESLLTEARKR